MTLLSRCVAKRKFEKSLFVQHFQIRYSDMVIDVSVCGILKLGSLCALQMFGFSEHDMHIISLKNINRTLKFQCGFSNTTI